jgi:hypothetical protein
MNAKPRRRRGRPVRPESWHTWSLLQGGLGVRNRKRTKDSPHGQKTRMVSRAGKRPFHIRPLKRRPGPFLKTHCLTMRFQLPNQLLTHQNRLSLMVTHSASSTCRVECRRVNDPVNTAVPRALKIREAQPPVCLQPVSIPPCATSSVSSVQSAVESSVLRCSNTPQTRLS